MKTEKVTKTVRLPLRHPSQRKQEHIADTFREVQTIAQKTAELMPSIPPYKWGDIRDTGVPHQWVNEQLPDHRLRSHDAYHGVGGKVAANFLTAHQNDSRHSLPTPDSYTDVSWFPTCACHPPTYEYNDGKWGVKLPLATENSGRYHRGGYEWFNIRYGDYQHQILQAMMDGDLQQGNAELHLKNGQYTLHQAYTQETEIYEDDEVETVIGIDLGLTNVAVLAAIDKQDGAVETVEVFGGAELAHYRDRMYQKRKEYQEKGLTEKVCSLKDKEYLFVENQNHTISRRLVEIAEQHSPAKIVLEDLTHYRDRLIREEKEYAPDTRRTLHSWTFHELQTMIEYKSREDGIPVKHVNPSGTSKECNKCGTEADRDGSTFYCSNCDYEVNADVNAAINIAQRAS